jgi:hypothetical protein
MRNLLAFVGLVVVAFLGGGYYFGWYKLGIKTGNTGNSEVTFDVNTNKLKEDIGKGVTRTGNFIDSLKKQPAENNPAFVGPPVPADWTPNGKSAAPSK